ncbi:MAG: DUF4906 domain-containing protein [Tannerellaceae bacterium]|nr:DUF4906 domain-containing protein [Tannerellaceae bacterium]
MANRKNTQLYICLSVLLLVTGMFSCEKNPGDIDAQDKYKEVRVNLTPSILSTRQISYSGTKAGDENISFSVGNELTRSSEVSGIEDPVIDNLWVFQFDDHQTLIRKAYQEKDPDGMAFTFELYESDNTTLFFIANLPETVSIDLELYSATIRDLQNLYFHFTEEESYDIPPLTGQYEGKIKENTYLYIELERMIAKLTLELTYKETLADGNQLNINTICLKNVPVIGSYYNNGTVHTPEENPVWFTDQAPQDVSFSGETFIWYIPENLQGTNRYISNQHEKGRENAPAYSTYIEITGEYIKSVTPGQPQTISIRLYPGENITTDFNIQRNACYPMTANILNLDPDNDKRIEIQ